MELLNLISNSAALSRPKTYYLYNIGTIIFVFQIINYVVKFSLSVQLFFYIRILRVIKQRENSEEFLIDSTTNTGGTIKESIMSNNGQNTINNSDKRYDIIASENISSENYQYILSNRYKSTDKIDPFGVKVGDIEKKISLNTKYSREVISVDDDPFESAIVNLNRKNEIIEVTNSLNSNTDERLYNYDNDNKNDEESFNNVSF